MAASVPKIVHQVFFVFNEPTMPADWRKNHEAWQASHPEYECVLWDMTMAEDLIRQVDPGFLATFRGYPHHIQRAVAVRPYSLPVVRAPRCCQNRRCPASPPTGSWRPFRVTRSGLL